MAQDKPLSGTDSRRSGAWRRTEVDTLIAMWQQNKSNAEIAAKIGRVENAVAIKASRLNLPPRNNGAKIVSTNPGARMRPCLCCRMSFFSEGSHNRICDPCREKRSSSDDYTVQLGGRY